MKKLIFAIASIAFGESGAKQSQDDKPLTHQEPVRTGSVDYSLWSHLSLHSRRGSGLTATWPLLAGLNPVQFIPARPFGLGLRFDEAPSGNAASLQRHLAPEDLNQTREVRPAYTKLQVKSREDDPR